MPAAGARRLLGALAGGAGSRDAVAGVGPLGVIRHPGLTLSHDHDS
ncbi:MAG TPA: hypothetical protein VFO01_15115 [Trebonia sp.]|nr:hypothetical protein [Trebonia sp.]